VLLTVVLIVFTVVAVCAIVALKAPALDVPAGQLSTAWCSSIGECAGKVLGVLESAGAAALTALFTWVGLHLFNQLP
jgi:hypothetical protein